MQMKAIEYRPAGVDSWSYTAKNSLMYVPEGMVVSVKEALKNVPKPREIVHENTRLSRKNSWSRHKALLLEATTCLKRMLCLKKLELMEWWLIQMMPPR